MNIPRGTYSTCALFAFAALTSIGVQRLKAQDPDQSTKSRPVLPGYFLTIPWEQGTAEDAASQALAGNTIPLSTYKISATKNGKTYSGTLVGSNPFASTKSGTSIPVVVVPLKVTISGQVFDPEASNSCDGGYSAVTRFNLSPLVQKSSLSFNGVNVGTTQYVNGFRRAEYWSAIGGSSAFQNTLSPVTYAPEVSVTTSGLIYSSGCHKLGVVGFDWTRSYLSNEVKVLQSSGVVSPTSFVLFLVKNVVQSTSNPPSISNCCVLGFHSAQGSPVQTFGITEWDSTGDFGAVTDGAIASHEIAEWMDDPLGSNPTPAWGNIGQVSGCQTNFEVGDPLSGTLMPSITMNGKTYHMQELAFFSWFFNKPGAASLGAGGKFSGHGKFTGPSKACPPGGTN